MNQINILGVNVSTESKRDILNRISGFLSDNKPHYLVTPNPEFLLAAQKDEEFFFILNKADIAIPDGVGLTFASFLMGKKIKRISGVDLMYDICALAEKESRSIFLLGGIDDTAKQAAKKLKEKFPRLKIAGAESGLQMGEWKITDGRWIKGKEKNNALIKKINQAKPTIIFVGFGHSQQEKWMYHALIFREDSQTFDCLRDVPADGQALGRLQGVKLAMGVGGSLDFISGRIKRAPKFLRIIGLEWFWRLLQEPRKRLPRIYDAVIKFPLVFFKWYCVAPYFYRPNVACLLYKKANNGKIQVLLAERLDTPNHWQLPQGGTDKESLEEAGARELREEVGTDKFKQIKAFKNLYRYEFGDTLGRADVKAKHIKGYRGQKQGLFIAEFTGEDKDITINFWDHSDWKWVDLNDVVSEVHEIRKEATKIFIDKFRLIISNK
ncbi:MAG: WecB/TagA/CpsF family glycosyltransferase [bacterium]|nr:WecB/TagA/CpsF family glycosyltransferase [bacterium]